MRLKAIILGLSLAATGLGLAGCDNKTASSTAPVSSSAPQGTISDELPDLDLLPNDAVLADAPEVAAPEGTPPVAGAQIDAGLDGPAAAAPVDPIASESIAR